MPFEDAGDAVEVAAVAALRQEHGLAFGLADARMIQVDVDDGLASQLAAVLALLEADEERAARDHAGHVGGVPALARRETGSRPS